MDNKSIFSDAKKKWLRTVPLYDDDPEILSNLASNTKVCTKAFRFLCVGESHLAKGTECNCTQRPCKRAVSCTVWMCHRDTPWSARWLPLSQRLLCFHSCYSNKTIAVADGQQYPPLWSSRQEKGGGYFAANIQDRWQSDSRLSLSLKIISTSAINIIYSPAAESTFSLLGLFHTDTYSLVFIWIYEDDD